MKRCSHPLLLATLVLAAGACSSSTSSTSSTASATDGSTTSVATSSTVSASTTEPTTSTSSTVAPTTVAPTTVAPTTVAPTTTPAPTSAPGPVACTVPVLTLALGEGDGAAGSIYTPLVFTNTGSVPCTLDGHPGVSFVDGAGNQIGPSAERTTGSTPTVTLAPGGQAHATLQTHDAGLFGDECVPVQAAKLKVYPPDETAFMTVELGFAVCTGAIVGPQFVIDVVQSGAGG